MMVEREAGLPELRSVSQLEPASQLLELEMLPQVCLRQVGLPRLAAFSQ